MDAWDVPLTVTRNAMLLPTESRAALRDVHRGVLTSVRPGVHVRTTEIGDLTREQRQIVAMRAYAAVASSPPVFTHWSAAVVHALPTVGQHFGRVHVTVSAQEQRGQAKVFAHVLPLTASEVVPVRGLLVSTVARTVVDIAAADPFRNGVAVADAAMSTGVARDRLEAVLDLAGSRRGMVRARDVVAFARPGAHTVLESDSRVSMMLGGIAEPALQFPVFDARGLIGYLDFWFPECRVGGEADGAVKLLDPSMTPYGPALALLEEKRREDRMRRRMAGFARWGARESRDPLLLLPILAQAGVFPSRPRATLAEYCAPFRSVRAA